MNKFNQLISNILFVSKLTSTKNKKILIFFSIILSQLSAGTDILLIGIFTYLIVGQETGIEILNKILFLISENLAILFLLIFLRFLFLYIQQILIKNIQFSVDVNLKKLVLIDIFKKRNFTNADSYFYLNQLTTHVSYFYSSFTSFFNNLLQIVAYASYLIFSNSDVTYLFFITGFILTFPVNQFLKKSRITMHESYEKGQKLNRDAQRVLDNLILINILNKEESEINLFESTLNSYKSFLLKNFKYSLFNTYLPSIFALFIITIALNIPKFAINITLDFMGVMLRMFQSTSNLTNSLNQLVNSNVHINEFYKLIKKDINIQKNIVLHKKESIKLENICFQYLNSNREVFNNLNLEIKKNSHTAIIGPNGSGKSTLLSLIAGIVYPKSGYVYSFSKNFAYVGPTPLVFASTLRENLLYGNKNRISDEEIFFLLNKFQLFEKLPNLDLQISNTTLSSGQMQKIAYIRALLNKPDILLLDESTSNIDEESKKVIYNFLDGLSITIINSTHEISNFKNIDSVITIEIDDNKRNVSLKKIK